MFCSNCGASVAENAPYCSSCGRPAQNLLQTPPPQPAAVAYAGLPQTDGKATGSMVLGILSFFGFWILASIPAIILGHISRREIRQSGGRLKGKGMALAGLILGYINAAAVPVIVIIATIGAIALPSFLRATRAGNDSAAASIMRTISTAQVSYNISYPRAGYARDLATLGPGPSGDCDNGEGTAQNACLLAGSVAGPHCTAGTWCTKTGFRFSMTAVCSKGRACSDFVAVATPESSAKGTKSFCVMSDAVVRTREGVINEPLTTVKECKAWDPMM